MQGGAGNCAFIVGGPLRLWKGRAKIPIRGSVRNPERSGILECGGLPGGAPEVKGIRLELFGMAVILAGIAAGSSSFFGWIGGGAGLCLAAAGLLWKE